VVRRAATPARRRTPAYFSAQDWWGYVDADGVDHRSCPSATCDASRGFGMADEELKRSAQQRQSADSDKDLDDQDLDDQGLLQPVTWRPHRPIT
jgi:hypothetical protein